MQHDEYGRREAGLEAADQCSERFQGAARTADDDDVTGGNVTGGNVTGGGYRVRQCRLQPVARLTSPD
jgi:hypothetical protein